MRTDQRSMEWPLVSAIMPTRKRPDWVSIAVQYFQRQDYPNKELIIAYEEQEDLPADIRKYNNVRLIRTRAGSLGEKRNFLALSAKGSIIIHFDDDDWYAPGRMSYQIQPIIKGEAEATILIDPIFFQVQSGSFWECSSDLYEKIFEGHMNGSTLAYQKSVLKQGIFYPDITCSESIRFIDQIIENGMKVEKLPDRHQHVYVRHEHNTWSFQLGTHLEPHAWNITQGPEKMLSELHPYVPFKKEISPNEKVSCILCNTENPVLFQRAIQFFQQQDYPAKELLIIDEGTRQIQQLIPFEDPCIKYIRLKRSRSIADKRRLACQLSRGTILLHWDHIGWVSNAWIRIQATRLFNIQADMTGLSSLYFLMPDHTIALLPTQEGNWIYPETLCFTKSFWLRNKTTGEFGSHSFTFQHPSSSATIRPHQEIDHYIGLLPLEAGEMFPPSSVKKIENSMSLSPEIKEGLEELKDTHFVS